MAHSEQLEFVDKVSNAFPTFFKSTRTLEIGSLDINGTVRKMFVGGSYIGLDVAQGPGVDIVCQGQNYEGPDNSFDTVISCEVMEHNPYWKESLANMIRVCRPGGLVIMTCATTCRKEHGTTRTSVADSPLSVGIGWEYYRNLTAHDIRRELPLSSSMALFAFFTNWVSKDLYFIGFKRGIETPPSARRDILEMRRFYRRTNLKHCLHTDYLRTRLLIGIFGEERFWSGPIRLW
jgi:SAM-dependent methyltransferase